jgi:hypothetical protein
LKRILKISRGAIIKKLAMVGSTDDLFDSPNVTEKFCRTFSNIEQLECSMIDG